MGQSEVIAPATGHLVDLAHDRSSRLPRGGTPSHFTQPIAQCLLGCRTRLRVHIRGSLLRLLPAEAKPQELKTTFAALDHSGFGLIECQPATSQPEGQTLLDSRAFARMAEDHQIVSVPHHARLVPA